MHNRKVSQIAVVPSDPGPRGDAFFDVWVVVEIAADGHSAPVDLSFELDAFVNGIPVATVGEQVIVTGAGGGCGDSGCGSGCGTASLGGGALVVSMICAPDLPCVPFNDCDCSCQMPPISLPIPLPQPLRPKDYLEILLRPSPGALPETNPSDDSLDLTHNGKPSFWNRKIESVELTPAPTGPNRFDVKVTWGFAANSLPAPASLGTQIAVERNGVEVVCIDTCGGWIQAPGGEECMFCDGTPCGPGAESGCGNLPTSCQLVEDAFGDFHCGCGTDSLCDVIPDIEVLPLDTVEIILKPIPGALPELPGFPEDDEEEASRCPWDLDGDGQVGAGDLAALIGFWTQCGVPADFFDDCVGADDLAELIGRWGPCP